MELEKEFALLQQLETSEKRMIRLIGNALAGESGSHVIELFDWLCKCDELSKEQLKQLKSTFKGTLPTVSKRFNLLMLKSLQYADTAKSLWGQLSLYDFETRLYFERGLHTQALHSSQKGEWLAQQYGIYSRAAEFIDWQRKLLMHTFPSDVLQQLTLLQQREEVALQNHAMQQKLKTYQSFLVSIRRLSTPQRRQGYHQVINEIENHPALTGQFDFPDLFTQSIVVDIKGLLLLASGQGDKAIVLYASLLKKWLKNKDLLFYFTDVYIHLFTNYQLSIFWGTISKRLINSYLSLLPDEHYLNKRYRLNFQRIRFGHLITMGMNTGQFSLVFHEIPVIEKWLIENSKQLPLSSQLAFRYNICITFFISGRFKDAYHFMQPIINTKVKGIREDILDFSRVLQAVILFEMGDHDLSEYLIRSTRLFLKRNQRQWEFEEMVLNYLRLSLTAKKQNKMTLSIEFKKQLNQLRNETSHSYPLLGLTEIRCWVESRISGRSIQAVFSEYIIEQKP